MKIYQIFQCVIDKNIFKCYNNVNMWYCGYFTYRLLKNDSVMMEDAYEYRNHCRK